MRLKGFVGPGYKSQSATADNERTVNWYVERMESQSATSQTALYPTPGVELIVNTTSTQGRAHAYFLGREFAVIGPNLIEFDSDGVPVFLGAMTLDANPATISCNGDGGNQLFVTSGGNGYVFDLGTSVFSIIAALSGKASQGSQLDGYFLALDANTGTFYASDLLEGLVWQTGIMFAQRNAAPDPWIAICILSSYIYLLGPQTSEVWYNNGASPFPFAKHPSGLLQYGIAAPWSLQVCDASLMWLGATTQGTAMTLRTTGFSPEVASNYPVQAQVQDYSRLSDCYGDTFTWKGHTFYVQSYPTANKTWCYDLQMQSWFELGTWAPGDTDFTQWRPRCHAFAFGEHRWLHATGTGLYRMTEETYFDVEGLPIRRLRRSPTLEDENRRLFYSLFELDLEPGLGLANGQGSDPQVMLRFSGDGGKTWSSERWRSAGKIGEYSRRVRWTRCGSGRRKVFEVSVTDPVPYRLTGAYIRVSNEASAQGAA